MSSSKNINFVKLAFAAAGAVAAAKTLYSLRSPKYILAGKVVMITGGSRGLGLVLAREFARLQARLVICARDQAPLDRARQELEESGAEVLAVTCDVTNQPEVSMMVNAANQKFGGIDVLINCAGIIQMAPLESITRADFEQAMNTHFWGPLNTIEAVVPLMRAHKSGRIVNIASVGGKISVPHLLPYCASKFALVGLSKGLRSPLLKEGIKVTTVCPGLMRTGSPRNAQFKGQHRAEYAWFSIGDSLPGLTVSAEKAARQIVAACIEGRAELIISAPAQAAVKIDALFPEVTADLMAIVERILPGPGGIGAETKKGKDSTSWISPSLLTALTESAAIQNNELDS